MKINLNNLGKQLKLSKRGAVAEKKTPKSEKEIFIDLISRMETSWNESAQLYEKFKGAKPNEENS
jgi:hypothetical protein